MYQHGLRSWQKRLPYFYHMTQTSQSTASATSTTSTLTEHPLPLETSRSSAPSSVCSSPLATSPWLAPPSPSLVRSLLWWEYTWHIAQISLALVCLACTTTMFSRHLWFCANGASLYQATLSVLLECTRLSTPCSWWTEDSSPRVPTSRYVPPHPHLFKTATDSSIVLLIYEQQFWPCLTQVFYARRTSLMKARTWTSSRPASTARCVLPPHIPTYDSCLCQRDSSLLTFLFFVCLP